MDLSSPCVYTPPDALGTSTGDSISTLPNTIRADTPRPSETGNMSTSVDSAGNATQQNDLIVNHLLTLSNMTATLLSQSPKLSPWQAAAVKESASAVLSAVGGESKNKPVDLATSPPSSDQDKSSCCSGEGFARCGWVRPHAHHVRQRNPSRLRRAPGPLVLRF